MDLLKVTVPGDPVAKSRPRTGSGQFYTPKRTRDAEQRIRVAALREWGFIAPWDEPVGIDVTFYCATRRRTDGDNLLKLVTDALQLHRSSGTKGVIVDDALIEEWHCRVHRRAQGQEPRTEIRLYILAPNGPEDASAGE